MSGLRAAQEVRARAAHGTRPGSERVSQHCTESAAGALPTPLDGPDIYLKHFGGLFLCEALVEEQVGYRGLVIGQRLHLQVEFDSIDLVRRTH